MSSQLQVSGEAKIRAIQGPVVANSGVITALDGGASQYVRGDGTLADFPTSTGGGSSVSYYLNSSVSQGTIGGVAYRQLSKTPISGAGTDIAISTTGYVASYLTDANDPSLLEVPAGNFNCEFYFSVNNNTGNPFVYAEVYKYDGTTFTLLGTSVGVPEYITEGTVINPYYFAVPVATSVLTVTDRIAIRIYVNVDGRTVTLHTENNHLCQVVTTFSKGLISLNNLTRQNQFFGTGTSGTDFAISSSTATHTFNLPVASATNTGKLSSTDWSTFNGKVPYTGATADVDLGTNQLTSGNAKINDTLYLKVATTYAHVSGYYGIQVGTNIFVITNSASTQAIFSLASLTTSRTFTLPDASGTLALTSDLTNYVTLGTSQNISGIKTFSVYPLFDAGIFIKHGTNISAGGYTGIGATTTGLILGLAAGGSGSLIFNTSSNYQYTFPSATGTLALTSDLSAYLPLAGGTLTGALSGTSATFSGALTLNTPVGGVAQKIYAYTDGYGVIRYFTNASVAKWQTGIDNSNSYFIYNEATASNNLTIASTGAATFSSSVTAGGDISYYNGANLNAIITSGAAANGRMYIYSSASADIGFQAGGSSWFTNNLGIGTNSPSEKLHISSSASSTEIRIENSTTSAYIRSQTDNLNFYFNGAERMRITSGGNIGIGATPSAWGSFTALQLANGVHLASYTSGVNILDFGINYYFDGTNYIYNNTDAASSLQMRSGEFRFNTAPSGTAGTAVTLTERMRITTDGDVLIGTTTASANLFVSNGGAGNTFGARNTNATFVATLGFFGADRNTTNNSFYYIDCYNFGSGTYRFRVADSGNVTNTNNSYGAISDIKLKENITNATPKLDDLLKVQIRNFNYIGSDEKQIGVIAQELIQVFPSMVDETNDKDANGKDLGTTTKSVKYSVFVPMLIKAMQEQTQIIKDLEARIVSLESK